MPKVRAITEMFHGGSRRKKGAVFDVTDAQLAEAAKRFKDRGIRPRFELVPPAKPAPKPAQDTSDIA